MSEFICESVLLNDLADLKMSQPGESCEVDDETVVDIQKELESYRSASYQDIEKFKEQYRKGSKTSGKSLPAIKAIAKHLSLTYSNVSKETLIDRIVELLNDKKQLDKTEETEGKFITNKNTFPRLMNILMLNPDPLARCLALKGPANQQHGEVREKQKFIVDAVALFNDREFKSGGLIESNEEFFRVGIDPDATFVGSITNETAWKLLLAIRKQYAQCYANWTKSGNNTTKFWDYCRGNVQVLYFHLHVEKSDNPSLKSFATLIETPGGYDSTTSSAHGSSSGQSSGGQSSSDLVPRGHSAAKHGAELNYFNTGASKNVEVSKSIAATTANDIMIARQSTSFTCCARHCCS